jgi:tripartite-type tricarboxylate transporter receptor subunit TctC
MMRALAGLALMLACALSAQAQDAATYPSKPVKIIVSTPAGGGVDTATLMVAGAGGQHRGGVGLFCGAGRLHAAGFGDRARVLAIAGEERLRELPDVPTLTRPA